MDECSKCGYPRLLHKNYALHHNAACTREMEVPNILRENWKEFNKRVKPILKMMKEEMKKDMEQGVLLQGLKELITSNTESIKSLFHYNTKKRESSPSNDSSLLPPKNSKVNKAHQSSLLD